MVISASVLIETDSKTELGSNLRHTEHEAGWRFHHKDNSEGARTTVKLAIYFLLLMKPFTSYAAFSSKRR